MKENMDIAISVKNLSKKYQLYDSPQHRLKEALHPFRKKYHKDFWALRDVSFEVKKGESIGCGNAEGIKDWPCRTMDANRDPHGNGAGV